jgi:hypothetical protein
MQIYKLFPLSFLSCFPTESRQQIAHYDKMWETIDNLKKERSFKVIKDKDRVVGYIDDEYVDKIFSQNKSIQHPHPKNERQQNIHQQPHSETIHQPTSIRAAKEKTTKQTTINTDKVGSSEKNSKEQIQAPKFLPEKAPVEDKVSKEKKVVIDVNKLNFYFSDLKISSNTTKKCGSFKINFINTNEVDLPDSFFGKLICKIEVIEGGEVILMNRKGDLNINNQKLTSIKRTFSTDNNVSIKFSLEKMKSAKIKISFLIEGTSDKILVVKNGKEETLNL